MMNDGIDSGMAMRQNRPQALAPSSRAASNNLPGDAEEELRAGR